MIHFLLLIIIVIYLFEFIKYINKLKIRLSNNLPVNLLQNEPFQNQCQTIPYNYVSQSQYQLEAPLLSKEVLKKVEVKNIPLPFDDMRAYYNKDYLIPSASPLPKREDRDIRWHCIRDWYICHTPTNYPPKWDDPLPKSSVLKYYLDKTNKDINKETKK